MLPTVMAAGRRVEQFFGPDDGWVEQLRQMAWRIAQSRLGHRHRFVREKGTADYVCTVHAPSQRVSQILYNAGYQRNILSTVKTRDGEYVHSAWVLDTPDTEWQQDVFIWKNDNGTTEVYSHKEPSVRNPQEHLDLSTGIHGDPDGRVRAVFHNANVKFEHNLPD